MPSHGRPLVSILLPVRDGARHLAAALRSLARQSFKDFEVIAVDDGSTDHTPDILEAAARDDSRLRVLRQPPAGIVAALELARREATGPLLARLDGDDVAAPRRLQLQVELALADPGVAICGAGVRMFPARLVKGGARRYEAWLNSLVSHELMARDIFVECPIPHPTFLMRADAVEEVGGYRAMGWPEDYDLLLRLWVRGGRMAKVPSPLHFWREGRHRLSRTHPDYSQASFRRCKVHYLVESGITEGRGVVVWGAGPVGKAFARELSRQGADLLAFVDIDPRKLGQEVHGVPVIPPAGLSMFQGALCLGAVGQPGARRLIRQHIADLGWREGVDFLAVA